MKRWLLYPMAMLLLAACSSDPVSPGSDDPAVPTTIDSFGATPNPSPLNVGVSFSWTVMGSNLICTLDAEGDGTVDYTVQDCSSQSRVVHTYGAQGAYDARLTVKGGDGQTRVQTAPVTISAANLPPTIPTLQPQLGGSLTNPLQVSFVWSVDDRNSDITHCQFDADSDGKLEYDNLCSGLPTTSAVKPSATVSHIIRYSYPKRGSYTATLTASDPYSATVSSVKLRVPLNAAPRIEALTATAGADFSATLFFRVSDADDDELKCTLSVATLGKFTYPNCDQLTRVFRNLEPGSYAISLSVTDGLETTSKTISLVISGDPTPPPPAPWIDVTVGYAHSCGLREDGSAWCWGNNSPGAVGDGTKVNRDVPTLVNTSGVSGTGWTAVMAGANYTCGLRDDKTAWCWGDNDFGMAGNNDTSDVTVPVAVITTGVSGTGWTFLTAGDSHTCGIRDDGTAWCWGFGIFGSLGGSNNNSSSVPVAVSTAGVSGTTWTALEAVDMHSCGIRSDGTAWCWGYNANGQLGNNSNTNSNVPVAVSTAGVSGTGWTALEGGENHSCGIRSDGTAWCWGKNTNGQLGNDSNTDSKVPVAVNTAGVSGTKWTAISARTAHVCGIRDDGTAWCWGRNLNGNLGNNSTIVSKVPIAVSTAGVSGTLWGHIGAGRFHSCGFRDDKTIWCWGYNGYGQLGNGDGGGSDRLVPVLVIDP